jgi:hypothetical protein
LLLWPRAQPSPPLPVPTLPPAPPTPPPAPTTPPAVPTTPPPAEVEVIVDSVPTGARIVRDGNVVGETPDSLRLTAPARIVLKKDGFVDKAAVVDAHEGRKLLVHLERAARPAPTKPPPSKVAAKDAPLAPYVAPPAAKPARVSDELSARVDRQAAATVPGGKRIGEVYKGAAAQEGGRTDWFVELAANRCYTFVGEGGDGVRGLYLYLWGPRGRRVADARVHTAHASMPHCTVFAGLYHFQAKIADGSGEYRVGIYQR